MNNSVQFKFTLISFLLLFGFHAFAGPPRISKRNTASGDGGDDCVFHCVTSTTHSSIPIGQVVIGDIAEYESYTAIILSLKVYNNQTNQLVAQSSTHNTQSNETIFHDGQWFHDTTLGDFSGNGGVTYRFEYTLTVMLGEYSQVVDNKSYYCTFIQWQGGGGFGFRTKTVTDASQKIGVFPNPIANHEQITITYATKAKEKVTILVYNQTGKVVKRILTDVQHQEGIYSKKVAVDDLDAGLYILRVIGNNHSNEYRVLKQ